jgi:hypothetical protein
LKPTLIRQVDLAPYGKAATSVAVHRGLVAAAVANNDTQQNGKVVFMDTDGNVINQSAIPDERQNYDHRSHREVHLS